MEMYTVSFFGHRIIDDLNKVQNELENIISKIVSEHEYVQFLVGRDGDFDIIAASAVRKVKKILFVDNVDLNLVLPYMRAEISNNIEYMLDYYNDIQVDNDARKAHFKTAIKIRNQNMVKKSQLVICYVERSDVILIICEVGIEFIACYINGIFNCTHICDFCTNC